MADGTYFDRLKHGLLDRKWIAIPLFVVTVVAGAAKLWRDLVPALQLRPVYFTLGMFELPEEASQQLTEYAALLQAQQYRTLVLESHTEPRDPRDNVDLAGARGRIIREELERRGIPPEKMTVIKFGGEEAVRMPPGGYADRVAFRIIWQ